MSRAKGRRPPRAPMIPDVDPNSGEGRDIGMSERMPLDVTSPIPGGENHIGNHATTRQRVHVPDPKPEYRGLLEHGVPDDSITTRDRADLERGPNTHRPPAPKYAKTKPGPSPVPVYIVEPGQGARPLKTLASDVYTVPPTGAEPIRIAGRDRTRSHILLLVETAAGAAGAAPTGIRIDHEVSNLDVGKGALLRAGAGSYLRMECNDELFAVSADGSACTLSVIYLYGVPGAG